MAERKILALYETGDDTFPEEINTAADSITVAGLTIHASGTGIVMNTKKITGLGAATADNDALAYGQSGANLAGLDIDTADLTMNNQKVTGVGAATASGDVLVYGQTGGSVQDLAITTDPTNDNHATHKAYVDAKVLTGASMKEAILYESQLDNTEGILSACALVMQAQAVNDDRVVLTDGTTTRTYYFGTGTGDVSVTIGGDIPASMQNLATAINGDGSGAWGAAYSSDLDAIDTDGVVVIWEKDNDGTASEVYGTNWGAGECQIVDFSAETDYTKKTLEDIPSSDPASTNFGFRRTQASLTDGEVHNILEKDEIWAWDDSSNTWQYYSGLSSIPDATAASGGGTKGKITVDSDYGLSVSSGILTINVESDGAIVFDSSNKGLEVNLESSNPTLAITTNELGVNYDSTKALTTGASGLEVNVESDGAIVFDASNYGLEVNLETTNPTLAVTTNELGVKYGASAGLEADANGLKLKIASANELSLNTSGLNVEGVPDQFNIGASATSANVTAANINTLVAGSASNADTLHTHSALEVDEAERIENDINVDEAIAVADPVYWTGTGDRIGKALANDITKSWAIGVAVTAQATVGNATNIVTTGKAASVLGGSGTAGARYWLQGAGGIGTTKPSTGERLILMGIGMNTNDLFVQIRDFGKRA